MKIVSLKQFAEQHDISIRTARRWIQQGMPHVKITKHGKCIIDLGQAEEWRTANKQKQTSGCLSITQTAVIAKVHRNTVRYWLKTNAEFRGAVVISGKTSYMIAEESLQEWLQTTKRSKGADRND